MEHVQLHIGAEGTNWRKKYDERMERLKTRQFPIQDSASQQGMLQQELSREEEIMNFELYKAVENGNMDRFVDMLEQVSAENKLSLSAIFDQVIPPGDSMLNVAANMGKEHIAELILYHFPKLLNKRNIRGDTALHVAAKSKSCGVIQVILTQYANDKSIYGLEDELTRLTNECGETPLHEAVYTGHLDVVTDLFHADRPVVHYLNKSGKSPLYLAVETGNVEILGLLLQTPSPQNEPLPQCRGNSPLHAAILEQKPALIKYILARRRELISLRDKDGWTALHYAAHWGYVEGVRILLNLSALTGIERDSKGRLPIHVACKRGHVMVVKELLQQEWPSPKVCLNQKGQNILHVAAKNGKVNVVKYLLRNKKIDQFTINEKDKNGNAPLHLASKNLFPKVLLVMTGDKRVDLNRINGEGLAALDIVLPRGILS